MNEFTFTALAHNTVLIGIVGAMLTGSLLWLCKAVPRAIYEFLVRALTVKVTVTSDDEVFEWINDWLAKHSYTETARRLKITSRSVQSDWVLAPGFGPHLMWEGWVPILVEREVHEKAGQNFYGRVQEKFTLTTFGRSQDRLRATIDKANQLRQKRDKLEVRLWQQGYWQSLARKTKRPLDSVFLAGNMLEEILAEAEWFFTSASWHNSLGIPYRHGWQFEGPPGTGKSTLAMAVASRFDRPIYILNLATVADDNALLAAFTTADPSCILLIEDVDTIQIAQERAPVVEAVQTPTDGSVPKETPKGITLSGLLNAIDGVASSDGRLLILTTNHPETLDVALTRTNRVDKRWKFGMLPPDKVREMVLRFFPDRVDIAIDMWTFAHGKERTASDWQSAMVRCRNNPDNLLKVISQ